MADAPYWCVVSGHVQGGNVQSVKAVGRLGKSRVIVQYQTKAGAFRERVLARDRVQITEEQLAKLPPYRVPVCPGVTFDAPLPPEMANRICERCGQMHQATNPVLAQPEPGHAYDWNRYLYGKLKPRRLTPIPADVSSD